MTYVHLWEDSQQKIRIQTLICLAQTYKKHAIEMQSSLPSEPVLFLKPASAVIQSGDSIIIPKRSSCLHHEIELGVVMAKHATQITSAEALDYVLGYIVCLDITARNLQVEAKKTGHPWAIAKGFDTFAPISQMRKKQDIVNPNDLILELTCNDMIRQRSSTAQLHWSVEQIISFISSIMTLGNGDIIFTGTPEGVGEILPGDRLNARLFQKNEILCELSVDVKDQSSKK
jgi:2-keto-4-pentenoate hydratase/2-oxohepta-3-ene-1,7-dioic acid hydratase in catechol pathway